MSASDQRHGEGRRQLLKMALSTGAVTVGAAASGLATMPAMAASLPLRIDVHSHLIPDFYRQSLASYGITTGAGVPLPSWSPDKAVSFMDKFGIRAQVVSVSEPGVYYLPDAASRLGMARQLNDYIKDALVGNSLSTASNRFGGFAVLPLGDLNDPQEIANASQEAIRAVTRLQLDGVGIFSSYNGIYLGDKRLDPLMSTLNDLGVMVFVHPVTPAQKPEMDLATFLLEFPFDTTRAATNMLYKGIYQRFPNIRWLLAHAGGAIPFLSYRSALLHLNLNPRNSAYSGLYFDTALSAAPPAMAAVKQITNISHIMFATDFPFSQLVYSVKLPGDPNAELNDSFNAVERMQVDRENALAQLPRLARRLGVA